MNKKINALTICFIVLMIMTAGCSHVAPPGEVVKKGCGPYPVQYEAMLTDFLNSQLHDPGSLKDMAIVQVPTEKIIDADYPFIPLFKNHAVWECYIAYDAKNKNGVYAGKSFHVVWIRHNRIVAFDYKDIDLDYAIKNRIHNKYLTENKPG